MKEVILLVEDNENDEVLTIRALHKNNIVNEVVVARDGEEALDFLFGTGKYEGLPRQKPVLTLLDIKLPKVNGIEVLRAIRGDEKLKLLPVVMLTSSNQEKDIIESYQLGVNSYIVKPVDFNQFSESVKVLGLYWLVLNEKPPVN